MSEPLIPIHFLTGLGGALLPILAYFELLKPSRKLSVRNIRIVAGLSLILIIASWITGGFYYVNVYGPEVKSVIKTVQPWAHYIAMESKEHIFFFMPFLAALLNVLFWGDIKKIKQTRKMANAVIFSLLGLGILMTIAGFIVSGAREAAGVIV